MAQDPTNLHIVPENDGKSFVALVQFGAQYFHHYRNLEDEEPAEREPAEKEAEVETVDDDDAEENSGEEDMKASDEDSAKNVPKEKIPSSIEDLVREAAGRRDHHHANKFVQHRTLLMKKHKSGTTVLVLAVENGNNTATRTLLGAGAAINAQRKDDTTALMLASQSANQEHKLERDTTLLDIQRKDGSTALMPACAVGAVGVEDLLIGRGAEVDLRDARGRRVLRISTGHHDGFWEIAGFLVDHGVRLDFLHIPIPNAQAALAIACRRGYLEVLELLDDKYHRKTDTTSGTGGQSGATVRKRSRKTSHKRS